MKHGLKNLSQMSRNCHMQGLHCFWQFTNSFTQANNASIIPEPTARSAVPGVSPGRGLLIPLGYSHPGKCEHSEVQSHPPCHGRTTNDGFCCHAHARVITDFKNMADYDEERTLKASRKGENAGRQERLPQDYKILLRRDKCWKKTETTLD